MHHLEINLNVCLSLSRKLPFGLIIALDESGNAQGSMYLDDGDQLLGNIILFL